MTDPVRLWAEATPDAPALVTGAETWTWADLDMRVDATAARLVDGPERVAVCAATSPALVVWVLAALRARRLLVLLSTRWPQSAVDAACAHLGVEVEEVGMGAGSRVPTDEHRAPVGRSRDLDLSQAWTVVHTSGSTGAPKPIVHTVDNHVQSARGVIEHLGLRQGDRWLLDLPLYHVGGLGVVVRCVLAGATLAVPPRTMPPAERVARLRPTHASFVATQLLRLLDADADLSSLRAVLLGGSAIPPGLVERARRRGVSASVSYGLTEMTSTVTATVPGADASTSGGPLAHRQVRISAAGEIEVGGPALAARLDPGGTLRPLGPWYPTGDLGMLDTQGHLTITGRRDLQFVSGGENVRPEAIEAALHSLDAVAEAVVVPIAEAQYGHRPVAFVRAAVGHSLDPVALADAVRQSLPGFMVPVAFFDWEGDEGMKPDRPALTREAERRAAEKRRGEDASRIPR